MGVYIYTLRSETKVVTTGDVVGRAAYAYKPSFAYEIPASLKRSITAYENAARRAEKKVGKVNFMVYGDKFVDGMDVYAVDETPVIFNDAKFPGTVIGKLVKDGRKWRISSDKKKGLN